MNAIKKIEHDLEKTKDPVIRRRLQVVKEAQEKTLREVAKKFNCKHSIVGYWKKQYEKKVLEGLRNRKRGRQRNLTEWEIEKIKDYLEKLVPLLSPKFKWTTNHFLKMIEIETGKTISERQFYRLGLNPTKKDLEKLGSKHKRGSLPRIFFWDESEKENA